MTRLHLLKKSSFIFSLALLVSACSSSPPMSSGTSSGSGVRAAFYATKLVGARYHYGGNSPSRGFDCSGLVQYSYRLAGVRIPRSTRTQFRNSHSIRLSELHKGDLLFFNQQGKRFSHVGIYIGNDKFVHAPSSGKRVRVSTIDNPYWRRHLASARRLY